MSSKPNISIRDYHPSDLQAVVTLFSTSVHALASAQYDAAQRLAWAPEEADLQAWQGRLATLQVRLAQQHGQLAGFIGFTANGHIELLFSAPSYAHQGVATALYRDAEVCLRSRGVAALWTEASLTARPFFARQGFSVEQAQTVVRGAVTLQRFAMRKSLRP